MGLFGFGKRKKQIIEYLEQADAAVKKAQYNEAIAIYQKLLKMEYWDARGLLGDVYRELGDLDRMKRMYFDGARCTVSTMSAAACRGYAECLIDGIGFEQDLKQAKTSIEYAEKAENNLIGEAAIKDAQAKRKKLKQKYWNEKDRIRKLEEEQKRLEDILSGRTAIREAVEKAPRDLIKGLHPFRTSEYALHCTHFISDSIYKITQKDVAIAVDTSLKEGGTWEAGFAFTTYGVASHYFISPKNMVGKSNFWEECDVTLPYYHLTSVEQEGKYLRCHYSDRKDIIVLAGDHAAWLGHILQTLIDTGYTKLPHISPFIEVKGKP